MFQQLLPLITERNIHILLSAAQDGKIRVYIEPVRRTEEEDAAFITPFLATATAQELDEQLPDVLVRWLTARQESNASLQQSLAAASAAAQVAADEAKKRASTSKARPSTTAVTAKPATKGTSKPQPMTPSLLDLPAQPEPPSLSATTAPTITLSSDETCTASVHESEEATLPVAPVAAAPRQAQTDAQAPMTPLSPTVSLVTGDITAELF